VLVGSAYDVRSVILMLAMVVDGLLMTQS